jgi:putative ABC transport system permease protein
VLALVIRESALLAGIGIVWGIAAALALTRLMGALLYGVSPTAPWVYGCASAALFAVAMLAAAVPAWRATRVDPLVALRQE